MDEEDDFHALAVSLTRVYLDTFEVDPSVQRLLRDLRQTHTQRRDVDSVVSVVHLRQLQVRADRVDSILHMLTERLRAVVAALTAQYQ